MQKKLKEIDAPFHFPFLFQLPGDELRDVYDEYRRGHRAVHIVPVVLHFFAAPLVGIALYLWGDRPNSTKLATGAVTVLASPPCLWIGKSNFIIYYR